MIFFQVGILAKLQICKTVELVGVLAAKHLQNFAKLDANNFTTY